jgi:hypothetical protein
VRHIAVRQTYIPERKARAAFLACGQALSLVPSPTLRRVEVVGWGRGYVGGGVGGWSLLGVLRIHVGFACVFLRKIEKKLRFFRDSLCPGKVYFIVARYMVPDKSLCGDKHRTDLERPVQRVRTAISSASARGIGLVMCSPYRTPIC